MEKINQSTNAMKGDTAMKGKNQKKWKRRKQSRVSPGCGGGLVSQKNKERKKTINQSKN